MDYIFVMTNRNKLFNLIKFRCNTFSCNKTLLYYSLLAVYLDRGSLLVEKAAGNISKQLKELIQYTSQ